MADDFSSIFNASGGDYSKLEESLKSLGKMSKETSSAIMAHTKSLRDKMKIDLDSVKNIHDRIDAENRYARLVKITGQALLASGGDMKKFTDGSIKGMRDALKAGTISKGDVYSFGKEAIDPSGKKKASLLSKVGPTIGPTIGSKLTSTLNSTSGPGEFFKGIVTSVVDSVQFLTKHIASMGKWAADAGGKIAVYGQVVGGFLGKAISGAGVVFGFLGAVVGAIASAVGQIVGVLGQIAAKGIEIMLAWASIYRKQLEADNTYLKQVDSSGRTKAPDFMNAMSGADMVAKNHGLRGMLPEDLMKEMTLFATQGMRAGFNGVTAESMTAGLAIKRGLLDGVSGFEEMANTETRYKNISMKATAGMLKVMQDGAAQVGLSWQKIGNVFTSAVNEASEFGIGQSEVGSMMKKLIGLDVELRNSGIDLNKKMGSIMKDLTTGTAKFGDGLTAFLGMKMGATDAFSGMTKARYGPDAAWQQDSSGKFTMTGSSVKAGDAGLNMMRESWKMMSQQVKNKGLSGDAAMFELKKLGAALMPGIAESTIEAIAVSGGTVFDKVGSGLSDEELLKSQLYSEKEIGVKLLTAGEHDAMIQRMMLELQTAMFNAILGVLNMVLLGIGRLVTFGGGTFMGMNKKTMEIASDINYQILGESFGSIASMTKKVVEASGMDPNIFKIAPLLREQFSGKGTDGMIGLTSKNYQYQKSWESAMLNSSEGDSFRFSPFQSDSSVLSAATEAQKQGLIQGPSFEEMEKSGQGYGIKLTAADYKKMNDDFVEQNKQIAQQEKETAEKNARSASIMQQSINKFLDMIPQTH